MKASITLLQQFAIPEGDYTLKPLGEGLINETYMVSVDAQPSYVLQQINTHVFPNVAVVMNNIKLALGYLKEGDSNTIHLISTQTGELYYKDLSENHWRLYSFVDNSAAYSFHSNPKIAYEAGKILADFHQALATAPIVQFAETIVQFHSFELRKNQFLEAEKKAKENRLHSAKETVAKAKTFISFFEGLGAQELPLRVCHNDTKLNNFLFDSHTQTGLTLVDYDTIMPGYLYYDFGDCVRTLVSLAPEDETDLSKISFSRQMFTAFVQGLREGKLSLTSAELNSLPIGAIYMPFLHGIRALTDYLENDTYYKTAYPDHNLDRCKSLLCVAEQMLENEKYMKQEIKKQWN